jgi:hypothetical protein
MQHHRLVLLVTGLFLVTLAGCASDSTTSSSAPPSTSQIAQAQGEPRQPPSGATQEPGTVQPPSGTEPPPSSTAGEPGPAAQDEPPAGEVQERAVPGLAPGPGEVMPPTPPSITRPPSPGIAPLPGVAGPTPSPQRDPSGRLLEHLPPCGPTENISKVANAIEVRAKSLTTAVVFTPGLALTQPVTINVALGNYCPALNTQSYVTSTGNRFMHHDCEGDGKPRRGRVDITLTEPHPAGGAYSFIMPLGTVILDPLYDILIGDLQFKLLDNCDDVGDSEINLHWYFPDGKANAWTFHSSKGKTTYVNGFAWGRPEVSASANLLQPYATFIEYDVDPAGFVGPPNISLPSLPPLVPGKTQVVTWVRKAENQDCRAEYKYGISYQLHLYSNL